MATNISSRFAKTGDFFLLEDTDLRGGMRVVASIAARDAIPLQARKSGMLVRVVEDDKISMWELPFGKPISNAGWTEAKLGGGDGFIPTAGGNLEGELMITDEGSINFTGAIKAQVFDGNVQLTQVAEFDPDDPEPKGMLTFNDGEENTVEINIGIGQMVCKTEVAIASDRSLKTNIARIENSLKITRRMHGYRYELLSIPGVTRTGLVAQEVYQAMPEATMRMQNGKLAVLYGNLAGLFVENICELDEGQKAILKRLDALDEAVQEIKDHLQMGAS